MKKIKVMSFFFADSSILTRLRNRGECFKFKGAHTTRPVDRLSHGVSKESEDGQFPPWPWSRPLIGAKFDNLPGDLGEKEGHFNGGGIPHRHHGLPSRHQPSRRRLARGWCPHQQQLGRLQSSSSWKIGNDTISILSP